MRAESVWVAAFNRWMPTGYVEGADEARLAEIDGQLDHNSEKRAATEAAMNKLLYYPKAKIRVWNEDTGDWDYFPKPRANAPKSKAYKALVADWEVQRHERIVLLCEKDALKVRLSGAKAQRRAEFLRKLVVSPEWIEAKLQRADMLGQQRAIERLQADDDAARTIKYVVPRQSGMVEAGKVTEDWEVALRAYAAAAQRIDEPSWWTRFKRWCRS